MIMIEPLRRTVGFIYADYGHPDYVPLGTGFFAWTVQNDRKFVYLVTCKHVVDSEIDEKTPLYVRLNRSDVNEVDYVPLNNEWVYHADGSVDLAVTQFDPHPDIPCNFEPVNINFVFLPDEIASQLMEGIDVAFIGLLKSIPGKHRNTPVYRYGHIAMILDQELEGRYGYTEAILIECVAYKGNSGSPLWISVPTPEAENPNKHTVFILGVMSEIYLKEYIEDASIGYTKIAYHSGLSKATPIKYVREIILGDTLMKDRKKRISRDGPQSEKSVPISSHPIEVDGNPFERSEFTEEDFEEALRKVSRRDKPKEGEKKDGKPED